MAIASLLLGCTHNASTQPPEGVDAAETPAAEAEPEAVEPEATPEPEPESAEPEPVAAGTDAATPTSEGGEPTSEGGEPPAVAEAGGRTTEPGTTKPETTKPETTEPGSTKPVVATLALPKPLHGELDAKCGKDPGVGQRLKSFALPGLEAGKQVTQGTFRGRVLLVNFWGTWCKPCLEELPEFDQLYRRYRKHGMTLLAIATDEDAAAVKELVDKRKLGAKIAIAGEDYAGQYGSPKFPFTFVVDHKGVIQASYRGYKPECLGQLEADLREQLEARAEAKAKHGKG